MNPITPAEFKEISSFLRDQCGVHLSDDQDYLVQTRLSHFAKELGVENFAGLTARLRASPGKLLPTAINLMTTNETLWFRDESCWNALEKAILPPLLDSLDTHNGAIKIWIAGCSTGQEAYSLAILIDEMCSRLKSPSWARRFDIRAMDISAAALAIARAAGYNNFEIKRGLSVARRDRYFECTENNYWVLRPNIRLRVHFEPINLIHDFSHLGKFDLILCRNVTIYFTREMRDAILSAMVNMLTPQGALLIGATESLWGQKNYFNAQKFEGCLYIKAGDQKS
jgi:chemotaxis protein methyltransferase CheR